MEDIIKQNAQEIKAAQEHLHKLLKERRRLFRQARTGDVKTSYADLGRWGGVSRERAMQITKGL